MSDPTCEKCGADDHPEADRPVIEARRPDGEQEPLCVPCYADVLAEETTLSARQAEIIAFRAAGYSEVATASALGVSKGTVAKALHDRIEKKIEDAYRGLGLLVALGEIEFGNDQDDDP